MLIVELLKSILIENQRIVRIIQNVKIFFRFNDICPAENLCAVFMEYRMI